MQIKCIFGNVVKYMECTPTVDGRWHLSFGYYAPLVDEVRAMEGAKFDPETKSWTVDACRRNTFAFSVLANDERYRRFRSDGKIDIVDVLKSKYPDSVSKFDALHLWHKFWNHQKRIYAAIRVKRRCIIAAVPRSGKTLPTLAAFMDSECTVCWWVTTKKAMMGVERELHKWYPNGKKVTFMSYDKFTDIISSLWDNVANNPPQFLVFDECHKLKTVDTQRTMAALILSEHMEGTWKDLEYVVGLSGTPAPKDPCDWWTQAEVMRAGYIREGNTKKFKSRYGKWKPFIKGDPTPAWERFLGWDKEAIAMLAKRLRGLVYIFLDDCLDLPPLRYEEIYIKPSEELLRVAKMIAETEDNPLTTRNKLRQLSDGFQYDRVYNEDTNTESNVTNFLGSPKLERLKEDLELYGEIGRVCVYAGFKGSLEIIRQTCLSLGWTVLQIDGRGVFLHENGENGITTKSDKPSIFMALGEMDRSTDTRQIEKLVVVAEPLSGGAGNEFSSSPVSIYYGNSDSGEARMQSEKRGHSNNMDMVRGHTILDYLLLPTDKIILDKLRSKKELQDISMGVLQKAMEEQDDFISKCMGE